MKKLFLLLLALIPIVSSCKKEESYITDVKGTKWQLNYYDQGDIMLKYILYLDDKEGGKCDVYSVTYRDNIPTEYYNSTYTVEYIQTGNYVIITYYNYGLKKTVMKYELKNNRLTCIEVLEVEDSGLTSRFYYQLVSTNY